jgi:hypothetical protein
LTEDRLGPGGNFPPPDPQFFTGRVDRLIMDLAPLLAAEPTEQVAARLRDLIAEATDLEKWATQAKAAEKKPHLDANAAIEAAYKPIAESLDQLKKDARAGVTAFLVAEEQRRAAAAAKAEAEAEAAREAAEGAAPESDEAYDADMADIAATHALRQAEVRPSIGGARSGARAMSLRTYYSVKVVDGPKLVAHFAAHPEVIAAAKKVADALAKATKGAQQIPGCEIIKDRRSA